jgi:hypothetical protein
LVPALQIICRNTHKTAVAADREISQKEGRQTNAKLQNAVQILQDSYSKTFNDRTDFVVRGSQRVVRFGLVWFGLVWFGLVWFGLVWFGLFVWLEVDPRAFVFIYRFLLIATN